MAEQENKEQASVSIIDVWLSTLPQNPPSHNMMLWMKSYMTPCDRACCYSPDCACIRCDGCGDSLTANGVPSPRNMCMECPLANTEDLSKFKFQLPKLTLCDKCFESDTFKHEHSSFCRVSEVGAHISAVRGNGLSPLQHLTISDFPIVSAQIISSFGGESMICQCCQEEFNTSDVVVASGSNNSDITSKLAVTAPGCKKYHGMANASKMHGVRDSHLYMCQDCAFQFVTSQQGDTYCDINQFCKVCLHEAEAENWRLEFRHEALRCIASPPPPPLLLLSATVASTISEDEEGDHRVVNCLIKKKDELKRLHLQLWIQEIIDDEFENVLSSMK
jgi:hypothetical protein